MHFELKYNLIYIKRITNVNFLTHNVYADYIFSSFVPLCFYQFTIDDNSLQSQLEGRGGHLLVMCMGLETTVHLVGLQHPNQVSDAPQAFICIPNNSKFITGQHRLIIVPPVYHSYCSSNLKDFKFAHVLLSGSHFYFSFQESVLNQIPPFTKIPNKTNKCSSEGQADCQKPIRFSD